MGARSGLFGLLSLAAGLSALSIDLLVLGRPLLAEGPPEFTPIHLLRMTLMAVCAGFFVAAVLHWHDDAGSPAPAEREPGLPHPQITVWVVLSISVTFLCLFVRDPGLFYRMAEEDQPIEMLSATLCLAACLVLAFVAVRSLGFLRLGAAGLSAAFFLIAGEELSWGQRLLALESPVIFEASEQGEINLHNFATNEVENVYYFAMFVLFVVAPFVDRETALARRRRLGSFFVPSRGVLYASVMPYAYNYDMWNVLATQLCFFVPLFILVHDLWHDELRAVGRGTLGCLAAVYVLTQVLFLADGRRMLREWDVTEYKELLLPLAALLFALELLYRTRSRTRPAFP